MKNSNLFLLINTLSGMGYSLAAPLFPSLSDNEPITEEVLGWIISTYSLAGIILTPFIPYLTNRYSRITLLIISTFLEATCTLLYGFLNFIPSYKALIIIIFSLRIIHGACSAIIGVLVYSLTISLTDENELELALGNLEIGWSIGTSSGPMFAGFFYGFGGYSLPFILLGLFLYISVYICNQIKSDKLLEIDDSEQNPSFIRFLKYPKIFLLLIGFIIVMILSSFYFPCLVNHLKENYSLKTSVCSLFFVIPIFSYVFILQFLDFLTLKFGHYTIYSFGLIVSSLSPLLLNPCPPFPKKIIFVITGFLLNGIGQAPVFIPGLVTLAENIKIIEPEIKDLLANDISSAINTLVLNIGEFIGPVIGGFFTSRYDFKVCCYLMVILSFSFSVIFIISFFGSLKNEYQNWFKQNENEVKIILNNSYFREGLIDNQIMNRSLQLQSEYYWNFKFEVISARRNYAMKRRKSIKNNNNSMIILHS